MMTATAVQRKDYYLRNRERENAGSRRWCSRNRCRMKRRNEDCYLQHREEILARARKRTTTGQSAQSQRERRARLRAEMIAAYGGCCGCCGEHREPFLSLEHIFGDGKADRKGSTDIYVRLRKQGWPKDRYRLLCMNCNWATRNGRACPHQEKVRD